MDGILPRALQSAFKVLRCWIPSAKAIYLKHQFRGAAVQEHLNELGIIWASSQLAVRFQALGRRTRMATLGRIADVACFQTCECTRSIKLSVNCIGLCRQPEHWSCREPRT